MSFNVSCESTEIVLIDHGRSMLFFPGWPNNTVRTKLSDHANNQPMSRTVRHPLNHTGTLLTEVCPAACGGWWAAQRAWAGCLQPACQPGPAALCGNGHCCGCCSGTAPDSALPWRRPFWNCIVRTYNSMQLWIYTGISQ